MGGALSVEWPRSKILQSFYITNYPLFFFVDMHLFASFSQQIITVKIITKNSY